MADETEGLTPGALLAAQAKANASFLEMEENRLLKMKKRQVQRAQPGLLLFPLSGTPPSRRLAWPVGFGCTAVSPPSPQQ
jgi:hypothetical protein